MPFVITINRQLGSGGTYVGQQLARKLEVFYADREIMIEAAKYFSVSEEDLESQDEKISPFWQLFLQSHARVPDVYLPTIAITPTNRELFKVESEIIKRFVKEDSAVIIGRCANHILREHPNHVSIFLHGDIAFRKERVKKLYTVSEKEAEKMIAQSDKERALYYHRFTGREWTDVRQYDISLDTSKIGPDKAIEFIMRYLK